MTTTDIPVDRLGALEVKIDRLADQIAVLTADVADRRRQRGMFEELIDDVAPLGTDILATITDRLDDADRKGYFRFAGATVGVADRVVENFDERDVEQLGANIVVMLEALREVTQPEMLAFFSRMMAAVQAEQRAVADEPVDPPSLWALGGQLRDPDVRRGMARALHTLRAVSAETGPRAGSGAEPAAIDSTTGDSTTSDSTTGDSTTSDSTTGESRQQGTDT